MVRDTSGLVMRMLSASTATGSLIFIPLLARLSQMNEWTPTVLAVRIACAVIVPLVAFLIPGHIRRVGARRFGETEDTVPPPLAHAATGWLDFQALFRAVPQPIFWKLFGSFFVCGLTTNGMVGVHMIAFCGDHFIAPVAAAGLLSLMGFFDLSCPTASGWLTDHYDPWRLLFVDHGLRGRSLIALLTSDVRIMPWPPLPSTSGRA